MTASRSRSESHAPPRPLQHPVVAAIAWCLVILAVAVPLTVARFRARTTD
jgi:uncharacterized iron-regulated membrane protein